MSDVTRITPAEIHPRIESGEALLVCAYPSDEKFQGFHLEAALSFSEFNDRKSGLPLDQEIVLYCA